MDHVEGNLLGADEAGDGRRERCVEIKRYLIRRVVNEPWNGSLLMM
jgi:hypothetical protein